MPAKKIVQDVYTIKAPEVIIDGNLIVSGSSTEVTTTNTSITDRVITLNKGESGAGVSIGGDGKQVSGIEIDRGTENTVDLRWNEEVLKWQITSDGVTYANILATAGTGSGITSVSEDTAPALGGNLNITSYTLYDTSANVTLYTDTVSGGGSGVFVDADGTNNQELVTKSKALAFSIIFG